MEAAEKEAVKKGKIGPKTFYLRAKENIKGSRFWELLGLLDNNQKKALLLAELASYPPETELSMRVYNFYVNSGKTILPKAGGYLDQPADLIQAIERIEIKNHIVQKIEEIDKKAQKIVETLETWQ
jgi:hypothetical protein